MILKRILAYLIDYLVIITFAALLFLITYGIHKTNDMPIEPQDPITGNLVSFFTLTLPVFLYFYFLESSSKKGTFGKQLQKIQIINNTKRNIFKRVFLKVLPWEIAHFGIHWSVYYYTENLEIPIWNWIVNITPQIIIIVYFISIVASKGKSSIYDNISRTSVGHIK